MGVAAAQMEWGQKSPVEDAGACRPSENAMPKAQSEVEDLSGDWYCKANTGAHCKCILYHSPGSERFTGWQLNYKQIKDGRVIGDRIRFAIEHSGSELYHMGRITENGHKLEDVHIFTGQRKTGITWTA